MVPRHSGGPVVGERGAAAAAEVVGSFLSFGRVLIVLVAMMIFLL